MGIRCSTPQRPGCGRVTYQSGWTLLDGRYLCGSCAAIEIKDLRETLAEWVKQADQGDIHGVDLALMVHSEALLETKTDP